LKIVIDTNVVASAVFFGGKPRILLEMLMKRQVEAYASPSIINEYQETCDELLSRYPVKPLLLPLNHIISACRLIEPQSKVSVCRDPDDNKFIECAMDAGCVYIVSGDKDLLSVKAHAGIRIVTVADFLDALV
jgi:putative PIN family toxin of toxin-antitoxin system